MKRLSLLAAVFFVIVGVGSSGCKKNIRFPLENSRSVSNQVILDDQAALVDVSFPLGISDYQSHKTNTDGEYIIEYSSTFLPAMIQDFYELDMERMGWRLLSKIEAPARVLLLFDKPHTWCIVVIIPNEQVPQGCKTTIFIAPKII